MYAIFIPQKCARGRALLEFVQSEDIIIVLLIVPLVGVELDVINHVNPRKNNVDLGVKSKQKKKIKINY